MVGKEVQSGGSKKLAEIDAILDGVNCYSDVLLARADILRTAKQLRSRMYEGDPEYMSFLLHVIGKGESVALGRKRKERENDTSDYCGEKLNDPQYENFLKCLFEYENSYVLKCGTVEYKYEEHVHLESDEDCDPGIRNLYEHDSQSPETMNVTGRMTRSKSKNVESGKTMSSELVLSSDRPICQTSSVKDNRKAIEKCDRGPGIKCIRHNRGTRQRPGSFGQMSGLENQRKYNLRSRDETGDETGTNLRKKAMVEKVQKSLDDEMPRLQRRRTRSSIQMSGLPNERKHDLQPRVVTGHLNGRELRNKTTNQKVQNSLADERPDPDYEYLRQHSQFINGRCVFTDGGTVVMYEKSDTDENELLSDDDESNSDVEIIDRDVFHNAVNSFPCKAVSTEGVHDMNKTSKFREQLINLLRKPYCEKEHEKLLQDVELRKPVVKHIELRNGRERSGSKHIEGKSYLDHYPGLERKLSINQSDKATCLNLLRGFFFWLQNSSQEGAFQPWTGNSLG